MKGNDDYGNKTLTIDGKKVSVGLLQNSENFDKKTEAFKSEVLEVTINGNQMFQVGNTMIFAEDGVDMVKDYQIPENIEVNKGGGLVSIDRFVNKIKNDIGKILRKLCEWKGVEIIEAEACPDHIHMLVSIPPKISVSSFMGYLKGKSSLMIFDQHANMKYRYGNREFWCRGYYVDTVGKNKKKIEEYIRNQLQEDLAYEQMSIKELVDPFTGEPVKKSNR